MYSAKNDEKDLVLQIKKSIIISL